MAVEDIRKKMRAIPAMDILLSRDWVQPWLTQIGRDTVKKIFNEELTLVRRKILSGDDVDLSDTGLQKILLATLVRADRPNLRRVINATGVVIHTNLGRSLLAESAVQAMTNAARGYCNLEYDLDAGTRGHRNSLVEKLLCELTGAEAALVVNNNAGAVLLSLFALSRGTEVITSRGELVEIGGSFRIPEIMELSGAKLVEVGTTNRTHLSDYEKAITDQTSMLLKVHPSNFRILGFTTAPEREDLARVARDHGIILMEDAGSGVIINGELLGIQGETSIQECLAQGVDLVTFSGDKMLGGPQIGAIVGRREIINKLRKHQLLRALRIDKVTLAAFEATLRLYRRGALDEIPTPAMLRRSNDQMYVQAEQLADDLRVALGAISGDHASCPVSINVMRVEDAVGGGSYPERPLSGWGVALKHEKISAGELQILLRENDPAIVCGAREDALVFHVRTLRTENGDEQKIVDAIARVIK